MTIISEKSWTTTYKYLKGDINYTQLHFLLTMEDLTENEMDEIVEKATLYYSHSTRIRKIGSWIILSLIVFGLLVTGYSFLFEG
jgi:hypothetical protein